MFQVWTAKEKFKSIIAAVTFSAVLSTISSNSPTKVYLK